MTAKGINGNALAPGYVASNKTIALRSDPDRSAGILARIKVTARIPTGATASVSRRNPPTMWYMSSAGYSQISIAEPGRIAFLSGQIAAAPGSEAAPKDLAGQAKLAVASLAAALEELVGDCPNDAGQTVH